MLGLRRPFRAIIITSLIALFVLLTDVYPLNWDLSPLIHFGRNRAYLYSQDQRPYPPYPESDKVIPKLVEAYEAERPELVNSYQPIELARPPSKPLETDLKAYIERLSSFTDHYLSDSPFQADIHSSLQRLKSHLPPPLRQKEGVKRRVLSSCKGGVAGTPDGFARWEKRLGPVGWEVEVMDDNDMEVLFDRLSGTVNESHIVVSAQNSTDELTLSSDNRQAIGNKSLRAAWNLLPKPVLKSDFLRYFALLCEGGIYTDSDTEPRAHPFLWGANAVPHLSPTISLLTGLLTSFSATPLPSVPDYLAQKFDVQNVEIAMPDGTERNYADDYKGGINDPDIALVVSIEWDAYERELGENWRNVGYARALQVVQWTMMAKPFHPVMLDVLAHVVDNIETLDAEKSLDGSVGALELTGPGPFTDAVFRYLLVQYGVTPADIARKKTNCRIGDVLLLKEWSFAQPSPQDSEWDYAGPEPENRPVSHGFMGRWKHDGWGD